MEKAARATRPAEQQQQRSPPAAAARVPAARSRGTLMIHNTSFHYQHHRRRLSAASSARACSSWPQTRSVLQRSQQHARRARSDHHRSNRRRPSSFFFFLLTTHAESFQIERPVVFFNALNSRTKDDEGRPLPSHEQGPTLDVRPLPADVVFGEPGPPGRTASWAARAAQASGKRRCRHRRSCFDKTRAARHAAKEGHAGRV